MRNKALIIIGVLIFLGIGTFAAMRYFGKYSLYERQKEEVPTLPTISEEDLWQEGDIRYNGKIYRYNEDLLTFLFLGIDEDGPVKKKKTGDRGGQSDTIFLMCINPHTEQIDLIGIPRDTMTDIDVYTAGGNYLDTVKAQITLQHAYGDGAEVSCERTVSAVRKLFYNIPVHGYCSINTGAIALLNDAVGGVEVTIKEDFTTGTSTYRAGEKVLLKGQEAHSFVRYRSDEFNSASARLERQKQYLTAFAKKAAETVKKNPVLVVNMYQTIKKYMVTDVTLDEITYLATTVSGYSFLGDRMHSLEGETVAGEEFEEFYPDEEALYDMILRIFYEEATEKK